MFGWQKDALFPRRPKKQAPYDEKEFSEWIRNDRIPEHNCNKKPELQFTYMSACIQAFMIRNDHYTNVSTTVLDVKYHASVVRVVEIIYELHLLLPKAQSFESRCNRWGEKQARYHENVFCWRKSWAVSFRIYLQLNGFADASKFPTEVRNLLAQLAASSVVPLKIMIDVVMYTFPGRKALKKTEKRNL